MDDTTGYDIEWVTHSSKERRQGGKKGMKKGKGGRSCKLSFILTLVMHVLHPPVNCTAWNGGGRSDKVHKRKKQVEGEMSCKKDGSEKECHRCQMMMLTTNEHVSGLFDWCQLTRNTRSVVRGVCHVVCYSVVFSMASKRHQESLAIMPLHPFWTLDNFKTWHSLPNALISFSNVNYN